MASVDMTVRGAGVFGLAIAWTAAGQGARVRVVDPAGPGGGASGGVVGALQPHTPDVWNEKKAFQYAALDAAAGFWRGVEAASGVSTGFRRAGRLQPLDDERAVVLARARAAAAAENWGPEYVWRVVDAAAAGEWRPASATGLYLHDTLSAVLNPRRATEALAAALRARGVEILPRADDAGAVVHATGWRGLLELNDALGRPVGGGVKGQAALLRFDAGAVPQVFAASLHLVPHADGTVAVGSTTEREFADPDGTDAQLNAVIERAGEIMPVLHGAKVLSRWAGVRPRAVTRAPVLGPWPGRPGHFVANGGFKIGLGIAPEVARVVCALVLQGRDEIPDAFRLDRE